MRRDLLRHSHQRRCTPMIANIRFHGGERLGRIVVRRAKSRRDGRRDGAGGRRRSHSSTPTVDTQRGQKGVTGAVQIRMMGEGVPHEMRRLHMTELIENAIDQQRIGDRLSLVTIDAEMEKKGRELNAKGVRFETTCCPGGKRAGRRGFASRSTPRCRTTRRRMETGSFACQKGFEMWRGSNEAST